MAIITKKNIRVDVNKVKAVKLHRKKDLLTVGEAGLVCFIGSTAYMREREIPDLNMQVGSYPVCFYEGEGNQTWNSKIKEIHTIDGEADNV